MGKCTAHFRFTPESGHDFLYRKCPLVTQSGVKSASDRFRLSAFKVGEPKMTTNTLALVTKNSQITKFDITVVSWVHNGTNRYIEISATNNSLGQRLGSVLR